MAGIKLICCDIDGTLVRDDKSLSEENVKWIRRVREDYGISFVITTGRMNTAIQGYYEKLGFKGPSSCLNGAALYDEKGRITAEHRIPREISKAILRVFRSSKAEMLTIQGDTWYTEKREGYLYEKKYSIYNKESILTSFEALFEEETFNKILFMSPEEAELDKLESNIRGLSDKPDWVAYYRGHDFLEIMPGGINKGVGIDDLMRIYGLERDEVMAIGDDYNDIEMLEKAGLGIAMGSAPLSVKKAASYVTRSNEEDGVAYALRHFFFPGEEVENDKQ